MSTSSTATLLRHLRQWAAGRRDDPHSDRELLWRFSAQRDETAFEVLVRRHGSMVLSVCRRILRRTQDAEDAFQATFLVLFRKAGSHSWRDSVGGWLHRVAVRVALRLRARGDGVTPPDLVDKGILADPLEQLTVRELLAAFDEELARLAESYREPLVLCYLEGKTQEEAARQLGRSLSTIRRRLEHGRQLLHQRLARRGLELPAALGAVLLAKEASAVVPASLRIALTQAVHGNVSARVALLADGIVKAAALTPMKATAAALLLVGVLAAGAGLAAPHFLASKPPENQLAADAPPEKVKSDKTERTDLYGDPLPAEAIARLGTTRFRHGYNVLDLAFTPDGTRLVSADWYGAHLWDAVNGREIRRLGSRFQTSLRSLSLSPDGKTVALAEHHFGTIQIVDLATGELRRQFDNGPDNNDRFCAVHFSPNGKILASYAGKIIRLWDPVNGEQLRQWQADPEGVHDLVFTPDSKTLISGGADRTIRFWEASTGKEMRRIADHPGPSVGLALSPDGKTLASLGSTRRESNLPNGGRSVMWLTDNKVHLWDTTIGKKLRTLEAIGPALKKKGLGSHPNAISKCLFAPDGKTLVTTGQDRFVRVWDVSEGKELRRWQLPWITSFAFSRDGKILATGGIDCMVRLWDWTKGRELRQQGGHRGGVHFLALSPAGRHVASASSDRTVRIWDAATGRELHRLRSPEGDMAPIAFSADGQTLTTAGVRLTIDGADSKGRVWDVASGKELRQLPDWSECSAYAVANDGRTYAFAGKDKKIWFWDAVAERKRPVRIEHPAGIIRMAFSPDARSLFSWCGDRKIHVWDIATGKKIRQFEPGDGGETNILAFSPDGRWLACVGREPIICLYDLSTAEEVRRFTTDSRFVNCLAFAPDGRTLAAGSMYDPVIYLWETASGQVRHRLTGHQGRLFALVFSADSKRLLSGSEDTTALLWDLIGDRVNGQQRKTALSPAELKARWNDLASTDAETAYQALRSLTATAEPTVDFLRKQLQPIPVPDPKRIARLIADLDHDAFARREEATKELEKLGEGIEPALRAAHSQAASTEIRQRTETLLTKIRKLDRPIPSTSRLQVLRGIEVLERIGTAEARQLLRKLAAGAPGARQTRDAAAALARLERRSSASP